MNVNGIVPQRQRFSFDTCLLVLAVETLLHSGRHETLFHIGRLTSWSIDRLISRPVEEICEDPS
jgi:hypothetical protein